MQLRHKIVNYKIDFTKLQEQYQLYKTEINKSIKNYIMDETLDTIQAVVLNVKLKYYKKNLQLRQKVASKYMTVLQGKDIILPYVVQNVTSAWAQFSIKVKNRDEIQAKLKKIGVPIAEKISSEIMSLPMNTYFTDNDIKYAQERL